MNEGPRVERLDVPSSLGFDVAADLRRPPGDAAPVGIAIFCHGFSGTKYPLLADGLATAGFFTVSIDFPGYGATLPGSGRVLPSEQIHIVREFGEQVHARLRSSEALPLVLVGASLGGSVALNAAVGHPRFAAFVLAHPLASGEAFLRRRYPDEASHAAFWWRVDEAERSGALLHRTEIALLTPGLKGFLPGDTAMWFVARFARDFAAVRAEHAIAAVAPRRVLVIHPTGDSMITTEEVRALARAGRGNVDLQLLEGGEHFIFDTPRVVELTRDWLLKTVADA